MRIFAKLKKLFLFRKRRAPKNGYCATMENLCLAGFSQDELLKKNVIAKNEIQPGSIEEYFERAKRFSERGMLDRICIQESHLLMAIELLIKEHPDIASTLDDIHTEIFTRVKVSLRHIK